MSAAGDDRLAQIFVRLYALRGIDADTIESLFFANLIGQVQIDTVVPYILKLGGAGVSVVGGGCVLDSGCLSDDHLLLGFR